MACVINENGDIELIQGDSLILYVEGIDTDENYEVFFSIYDSKGRILGEEVSTFSNKEDLVVLEIPSTLTNLCVVKDGVDSSEDYYYGIKTCLRKEDANGKMNIDFEDTLCIEGNDIGDLNTITVYPRKVEGI